MNTQPAELPCETSLYVYAIIPTPPGTDTATGITPAPNGLRAVAAGPFAAVVGDGPNFQDQVHSREELVLQLAAHQKAIEHIMRTAPVLPVKFGTFLPNAMSIRAILERGAPAFQAAFDRLADCVQVEILIKWDVETIFAEIAKEDAITDLKKKWTLHTGAPDDDIRAAIGRQVKQSLDHRRAVLAASLSEALRAVAVDAITDPAAADQVVLHLVLLMKADAMAALDHCLETLDAAYAGQLTCRVVGPLAPYSFATVEIEIIEAVALAKAMRLLGVGAESNAAQVRLAYRRAAKSVHPDAVGAGGNASMRALTEACRILMLNAETCVRPCGTDEAPSATDLSLVGRSVLVSIRRQEDALDVAA
jgi:hypothetical protein